jgi:hypothetical protein
MNSEKRKNQKNILRNDDTCCVLAFWPPCPFFGVVRQLFSLKNTVVPFISIMKEERKKKKKLQGNDNTRCVSSFWLQNGSFAAIGGGARWW